jgi:hypothetical protein
MGRWFGYRKGYEDLVRIYTSELLWKQYKDLAIVELEFRANVQEMINEDKKPREFSIGVRQILGMLPVSKNKLGAASLETVYGGSQVSVTRLTLEQPDLIDENIKSTKSLLEEIKKSGLRYSDVNSIDIPTKLTKGVSIEIILKYLNTFNIAKDKDGKSLEFNKDNLIKYINQRSSQGELKNWNVGIVSIGPNADNEIVMLTDEVSVRCINRARLKTSPINGAYNIKAVSSRTDRMMDLKKNAKNEYDDRNQPLLLIYCISKNSIPVNGEEKSSREALYKNILKKNRRNPISFSIIFPSENESKPQFIQKIEA